MMESLQRMSANPHGARRAVSFRWTFLIEHSLSRFETRIRVEKLATLVSGTRTVTPRSRLGQ
jgi:hypothetical protein